MSEKQVRKTGTNMDKTDMKQTRKMKTRCYYTDYVNHAIRFYLTTPDTLHLEGKRKADAMNWMAVQAVFHALKPEEKQILTDVYGLHHRLPEGVRMYCEKTGADERKIWVLITKVAACIARRRGLV